MMWWKDSCLIDKRDSCLGAYSITSGWVILEQPFISSLWALVSSQAKSELGLDESNIFFNNGILGWSSEIAHLSIGDPRKGRFPRNLPPVMVPSWGWFWLLPTKGDLAMSKDIFNRPNWGGRCCYWHLGILLSIYVQDRLLPQWMIWAKCLQYWLRNLHSMLPLCFLNMGAEPKLHMHGHPHPPLFY